MFGIYDVFHYLLIIGRSLCKCSAYGRIRFAVEEKVQRVLEGEAAWGTYRDVEAIQDLLGHSS